MTVLATTVRRLATSHAFVVPVVRELAPARGGAVRESLGMAAGPEPVGSSSW
jgi:hypothetical protein